MIDYLTALYKIRDNGVITEDRTGTGTISLFGELEFSFDLSNNDIPLLTTKRVHVPSIIHELLWMLSGDSNIKYLNDNNVTIWDEWADENGDLGPVYGSQWRAWEDIRMIDAFHKRTNSKTYNDLKALGYVEKDVTNSGFCIMVRTLDQIHQLESALKAGGTSRRMMLTAWNVGRIDQMALPPCHTLFQLGTTPMSVKERQDYAASVSNHIDFHQYPLYSSDLVAFLDMHNVPTRKLSGKLYMRSADFFLGVPFNMVFYAVLTRMFAATHNFAPGNMFYTFGDAHIYLNHLPQVQEQLRRDILSTPTLHIPSKSTVLDYTYEDFDVTYEEAHPAIRAKVAV